MERNISYFHEFVNATKDTLIVQPRMGFSAFSTMREGLERVKNVAAATIGTITLDSFTRTGDFASAQKAIENGSALNGYPIVSYGKSGNERLIGGLIGKDFPIQVRHGCSRPEHIFRAIVEAGIDATEGGPISYCFPYGKVPLQDSIRSWQTCSEMFAAVEDKKYHLESFGGCMMGQLCPPSMLIAITIAEALFFRRFGVQSYSVSLTQGSNIRQDIAALAALHLIGEKYLGSADNWHVVYYTFMGKFPETMNGARALMRDSVLVAKAGGAKRLIVKTAMEAHQIPTIEDNIEALEQAHQDFHDPAAEEVLRKKDDGVVQAIYEEADFLVDLLLNLNPAIERAIELAFKKGYWDVPFCLHPNNNNAALAKLNEEGFILWANAGKIPFPKHILNLGFSNKKHLTSDELLFMLSFNQFKYDMFGFIEKPVSNHS
ncbi:MAG: hypothetical protein SH848_05105 [Saprospiraceae bacterium]|nr:hypothetical protein [Saprospiraceae bacterium]MDZ4703283.1 hypothetical protein [Saprospiraceae bacterium]